MDINVDNIKMGIKEILMDLLKCSNDFLDAEKSFLEIGINSIQSVELVESINQKLGLKLGIDAVFDYTNINELAGYIFDQFRIGHCDKRISMVGDTEEGFRENNLNCMENAECLLEDFPTMDKLRVIEPEQYQVSHDPKAVPEKKESSISVGERGSDIAIIGISGRFAGAENVEEFWNHLQAGDNCIEEINRKGWDESKYYSPDSGQVDRAVSKWGGLLNNIEEFDALFFNISPLEAERMDPQQRLFLQEAYRVFEDAGYSAEELSGRKVGVFVGGRTSDYKEKTLLTQERNSQTFLGNDMSILAARISYFLNLKGPNIAIDTACSSSLVAIHLACESIHSGRSEMALAGGVFVLSSPEFYVMASKTEMLSPDGQCKTFDNRANGIALGEGVGVLLMKKLEQAVADGDYIYGVIKGSSINQDGKTKGITAPSMLSQKALLYDAYKNAAIHPETVSFIETHGTGTKLGDPIEVKALTEAFQMFTNKSQFCAIGSHKPNFGHAIMSAGIAGVLKVLMAMKYRKLPPQINITELNEHIDLNKSPFFINRELREWKSRDGGPLRAGVSAFGFSGTNCHAIIEEAPIRKRTSGNAKPCYLFPFSAKTKDALERKIADMIHWFEEKVQNERADEISYTLLAGRSHFSARCIFIAEDLYELQQQLIAVAKSGLAEFSFREEVKGLKDYGEQLMAELREDRSINAETYKEKLSVLSELYISGYTLNWANLFDRSRRVPLPTYPFAREHYWIPDVTSTDHSRVEGAGAFMPIHPLVQRNTSDLSEQRFSSTFTGQEFFLKDHVVKGKKVLPGAAYIEMARAAVEQAAGGGNEEKTKVRLTNMVWMRPILVDTQAAKIHIGLYPEPTGEITYEIYDEAEVYSKGNAVLISGTEAPDLDIEAWKTRCNRSLFSSGQCYETFKEMGMEYGPGHRGIDTVYLGENQVLAKLSLPSTVSHTRDQYIVHPSLLDSALQASSYLLMERGEGTKTMLPFALQEVEVIDHCTPAMWALIRYHTGSANKDKIKKIDIDLCNETGKICIKIKGFSTRVLEEKAGAFETAAKKSVLLFHPCWKEKASTPSIPPLYEQRLVILCEPDQKIQESIEGSQPEIQHLVLQCQEKGIEERFQAYAIQIFEQIQIMMKNKRKENILIQIVVVKKNEGQLFSGLSGLLKTAQLENPKLRGQIIEVDREEETGEVVKKVEKNSYSLDFQIRYQNGKRYVMEWKEIEDSQEKSSIPWKDQGVYLITGGIGGLGRIFTREIISKAKDTTIILTGRSPLNEEKRGTLKELEAKGGKIEYKQVDVTDKKGIIHLVQSISKEYGNLDGIIHGAGIIEDNFIFKKSKEEMQKVISPKVSGLVNLDEASKGLPLDFFIFFSSIAGSLGNAGQSDYSVANAFMDSYANYRNELVGLKERYGRTLSVNWPLWKEGGMHVDEEVAKRMLQKMGILPLETAAGIQALYRGLASGAEQVMVLEGECQHLREFFTGFSPTKEATPSVTQEYKIGFTIEEDLFQEKISDYFRKIIASTIKVPMKEIDAEDPMDEYGIDSIIAMQITSNLEEIFGSLPKTLFFEYQNIKELTAYFFEFHSKQLLDLLGIREEETTVLREFEPIIESVKSHEGSNCSRPRFIASREESRGKEEKNNEDIAIIGVSGRYPGAKNIGELWTNLQAGRDCITEVPKERWDYHTYYDEDKNKSGKTYCKWGGFLENSDRFDSLFFAISPEEAKFMNPQDRLFMETVWNLFESAGYTRESLKHQYQTRVGVYVGSMYQDYDSKSSSINELSTFMCSSIANRISQYFNLQGPSVVIDSMSSSSAIAIHMACESLIRGECRLAIAGGVNLLYLQKYLRLSKIKMIGSHIHSRSFGDGDGYLPAEGVGAVLLKSLTQAIKDGDRILAVIKSSVTNHGGHTNGAATPNINAQIQLIEDNFKKTGMDPRTISYVEAAANGFPVGDLIEISALDKAFHKFTNDQQFCAIGSIKANIGHAEAASGVSQLTKVILQLQHQQLVPAIGTETLNPNIHFEKTPFYIQRKLTEWKRPMVWIDGEEREVPRRATVSSFGAGGSNVHLIVEEYIPSQNETIHVRSQISPQVVVLSAKNQERLLVACQQMLAFIECREELFLQDIAYTLQVGREAMESRVAMVVNNREELIQGLKEYLKHPKERACVPIFAGNLEEEHEMKNLFSGNTGEKFSQVLLAEKNLKKIAMYWSQGGKIPWDSFHEQNEVRKIFLPSYPFEECHVVSI